MKLSTREDIDAPIDRVYEHASDFDAFERLLLRRGVEIARDESCPPPNPGARWEADFEWRGRQQHAKAELVSVEPGSGYAIESKISGVKCLAVVDLVALSKSRTRMFVSFDLRPTTLSSRVFLQTLKLTKGSLTKRFKERVSAFAEQISA